MRSDIAMVIADLEAGGAQRVVTTLANAWAEGGRRVSLITFDKGGRSFFPLNQAIDRQSLDLQSESRSLLGGMVANARRVLRLRRAIRACGAPVVVSFVGATNVLAVLASRGLGLRLVICERNDPARQSLGRLWDWLRDKLYRRADVVTANSQRVCATLQATVPTDRLRYLPNPLVVARPERAIEQAAPTILSVGRLSQQKGYDLLLKAFAASEAREAGWRLAIIGDGPLRDDLRALSESLGLADRVDWRGRQSDAAPHYAAADIFVMASRHEGMPNALLEAMALGCPAIVTEGCGAALEILTEGDSGLIVPREDVAALTAALDRLAADAALRKRLAAAAARRVQAFELEQVLPLWDEVLALPASDSRH